MFSKGIMLATPATEKSTSFLAKVICQRNFADVRLTPRGSTHNPQWWGCNIKFNVDCSSENVANKLQPFQSVIHVLLQTG